MSRRILLSMLIIALPTLGAFAVVMLGLFYRYPIFGLFVVGLSALYLPPLLFFSKEPRVRIHPKTLMISYSPGMSTTALYRGLGALAAFTVAFALFLMAWS